MRAYISCSVDPGACHLLPCSSMADASGSCNVLQASYDIFQLTLVALWFLLLSPQTISRLMWAKVTPTASKDMLR
jgi:hypothetical protein